MWKPMQKQRTPRKHEIGEGIPTNNIILLILFDKGFSSIVVCTSFIIDITSVPRRWLKNFEWKHTLKKV